MNSLFYKIYARILLSAVILCVLGYALLAWLNKIRFEEYLLKNISGTFVLISEGITRHKGSEQQLWVQAVERLLQMKLEIDEAPDLTHYRKYTIGLQTIYISSSTSHKYADIAIPLPNVDERYLISKVNNINQTIGRVADLLILNELGRFPKQQRNNLLTELDKKFSYDLQVVSRQQIALNKYQWRQLDRGDIVTQLLNSDSDNTDMKIYATFGNSGKYLVLGPISVFQWYPVTLLLPLFVAAVLIWLLVGFVSVHSLEKKLQLLEDGINLAGTTQAKPIKLAGSDGIAKMAHSINTMILRIDTLITQKQQLINDISHELRTPVARLMFRLENLVAKELDESTKEVVGMKRDLDLLHNMLDEILNSASLEHATQLQLSNFDLLEIVQKIIEDMAVQYPKVHVDTITQYKQLLCIADHTLLKRALENLLLNACRYSKGQVSINVTSKIDDENELLIIQIEDDGPGIPECKRAMIFEPFFRGDKSRNRASGGFGLGLSIVHNVVHQHQGNIEIKTGRNLGGACFQMSLRLKQTEELITT